MKNRNKNYNIHKNYLFVMFLQIVILLSSCNSYKIESETFSITDNKYEQWINDCFIFNKKEISKYGEFERIKNDMNIIEFEASYLNGNLNALKFSGLVEIEDKLYIMSFQNNNFGKLIIPVEITEKSKDIIEQNNNLNYTINIETFIEKMASLNFNYLTIKLPKEENNDDYLLLYSGISNLTKKDFAENGILVTKDKYLSNLDFEAMEDNTDLVVLNLSLLGSNNAGDEYVKIYIE